MHIDSVADLPIPPDHLLSVARLDDHYRRITLAHVSGSPAATGVFHVLDLLDVAHGGAPSRCSNGAATRPPRGRGPRRRNERESSRPASLAYVVRSARKATNGVTNVVMASERERT
jgi:hypothetical protein